MKVVKMERKRIPNREFAKDYLRFSQNFLKSPELARRLVRMSTITGNDLVYEIGPGKGILTRALTKRCGRYIGVEKDRQLCAALQKEFLYTPNVEIRCGDFLTDALPKGPYKVFASIPFNLTAAILTKLTRPVFKAPIDSYLIIQKEAATQLLGRPRETQKSLLFKPWFSPTILHYFKPNDFKPAPRVDIVLLRIQKRRQPFIKSDLNQLYRDFITYGFNRWKITVRKDFKDVFTYKQFKRLSHDLSFDLNARPADLTLEQWLGLFEYFLTGVEEKKRMAIMGAEKILQHYQSRLKKQHRTRTSRNWKRKI